MSSESQSQRQSQQITLLMGELQRSSDLAVLFNQAVALRGNIPATDLKVLSFLSRLGALSAGRIATLTGLSTGAVTFMLDRLEKTGYVRRVRHPNDRRSVLVELNRELIERDMGEYFALMEAAAKRVIASYSEEQLAVILDFTRRNNEAAEQVIAELRDTLEKPTQKLS